MRGHNRGNDRRTRREGAEVYAYTPNTPSHPYRRRSIGLDVIENDLEIRREDVPLTYSKLGVELGGVFGFIRDEKGMMRVANKIRAIPTLNWGVVLMWHSFKNRGFVLTDEVYSSYTRHSSRISWKNSVLAWKAKWFLQGWPTFYEEAHIWSARKVTWLLQAEIMVLEKWGLCDDLVLLVRTWAYSYYGPEWFPEGSRKRGREDVTAD
jgi:hypothetical protein